MADDRMAVLDTVRKALADGDVDFLREGVRVLAQAVMEAEVSELTGVPRGERDEVAGGVLHNRREHPRVAGAQEAEVPLGSLGAAGLRGRSGHTEKRMLKFDQPARRQQPAVSNANRLQQIKMT